MPCFLVGLMLLVVYCISLKKVMLVVHYHPLHAIIQSNFFFKDYRLKHNKRVNTVMNVKLMHNAGFTILSQINCFSLVGSCTLLRTFKNMVCDKLNYCGASGSYMKKTVPINDMISCCKFLNKRRYNDGYNYTLAAVVGSRV